MLLDEARGGWCAEDLVQRFIDVHSAGLAASGDDDGQVETRVTKPASATLEAAPQG
jgi:hypothetical protein